MAKPASRFGDLKKQPAKAEPTRAATTANDDEDQPSLPIKAPKIQRSRRGKKAMTFYVDPELSKAVRLLAVEHERSLEDLATEALNDFLRKNGRHPV